MSRRPLALLPALCSLALPACRSSAPAEAGSTSMPCNVLVLLADDLRRDAVGALGGADVHTPNLDALAARGTALTGIACMGSRHGAVCVPSRAMLLTGAALPQVTDNLAEETTLPELLRERGYATFLCGKWHNGRPALQRAFPDAASVFVGGMCDHFRVPLVDVRGGELVDERQGDRHSSELFADAAIAFLERHAAAPAAARPFFAWVAFTAPHDPRDPPPAWLARLDDLPDPPLPAAFRGQHGLDLGQPTMAVRDEQLLAWPRDPQLLQQQLREYRALVAHLDEQIGRVLAALERTGRAGDTLVVFAADHGLALGSHGLLGKQSLYEHSMGAPVVLAGPGVPPGGRRQGLGHLHDLFATILAATGSPVPPGADARDLMPLVRGEDDGREVLFTLFAQTQRAVRDRRYKLIRLPNVDRTLLFDLQEDPDELRDLAGDPAAAPIVARLSALLRSEQQRVGDALPWTAAEVRAATVDLTGRPREPDRWQPPWIVEKYFR